MHWSNYGGLKLAFGGVSTDCNFSLAIDFVGGFQSYRNWGINFIFILMPHVLELNEQWKLSVGLICIILHLLCCICVMNVLGWSGECGGYKLSCFINRGDQPSFDFRKQPWLVLITTLNPLSNDKVR